MKKIILGLAAATAFSVPMISAADTGNLAVGVKGGTLGLGVELNYPISSMFTVSAGLNNYSKSFEETADDIDYDTDLNLNTISLLANYHPFAGSFRLTAGAMINNNKLEMTAKPNGATITIDDNTYDANNLGSLEGGVDFARVAPYAGIGWGFSSDNGIGFTLDLGVLMQGSPNLSLETKNTDYAALSADTGGLLTPAEIQAQLEGDLAAEESKAEDDIKGFTMYPVVSAGIVIRF